MSASTSSSSSASCARTSTPTAMHAAWQRVADRHPIMRTRSAGPTVTSRCRRSSSTSTSAWPSTTCAALTAGRAGGPPGRFLVDDRRAGFDARRRAAVAPHAFPARTGPTSASCSPTTTRCSTRAWSGSPRRRSGPTTRLGAARWPSSSSGGRTGTTSSGCTDASRRSDRRGGAGRTTPSCSTGSTRRPSCRRWRAPRTTPRPTATTTAPIRFRLAGGRQRPVPRLRRSVRGIGRRRASSRRPGPRAGRLLRARPTSCSARPGAVGARACRAASTSWGCSSTPRPCGSTIDPTATVADAARRRCAPSRSTSAAHEHTALSDIQAVVGDPAVRAVRHDRRGQRAAPGHATEDAGRPVRAPRLRPPRPDQLPADAARLPRPPGPLQALLRPAALRRAGHRAGARSARPRSLDGHRRPRRRARRRRSRGCRRPSERTMHGVERRHRPCRSRRTPACTSCSRRRSTARPDATAADPPRRAGDLPRARRAGQRRRRRTCASSGSGPTRWSASSSTARST